MPVLGARTRGKGEIRPLNGTNAWCIYGAIRPLDGTNAFVSLTVQMHGAFMDARA